MAKGLRINPYTIQKSDKAENVHREIEFPENKPELFWGTIGSKDAFKLDEKAWESVFYRS